VANPSARDRVLKRNPLRDETALVQPVDFYAPVKRRAAMCYSNTPALAFAGGGFIYYPPAQGAIVRMLLVTPDTGGTSTWRFGLAGIPDLSLSIQAGVQTIVPVWSDAPLLGQFESFHFNGIGDRFPNIQQGLPVYPDLAVMPPNILVAALTVGNLLAEGGLFVEEFLGGDEGL